MTFEELLKDISGVLKRITYKLNRRFSFFDDDDLYQEALVHLWRNFQAGRLKDKTHSYILQGCYFHLKNYLRKVKAKAKIISLDTLINGEGDNLEEILFSKNPQSCFGDLDTRMIVERIKNNGLNQREKEIFPLSLGGFTVREIGNKLGISHVMVVKIKKGMRKKIQEHLK